MADLPIGQGYLLLLPGATYEVTDEYAVEALKARNAEIERIRVETLKEAAAWVKRQSSPSSDWLAEGILALQRKGGWHD